MSGKKQIAKEIVSLMSHGGPFAGLWTGDPMTEDEVIEQVGQHKFLPMQNGHTKNSLPMQNTRRKIYGRVGKLMESD